MSEGVRGNTGVSRISPKVLGGWPSILDSRSCLSRTQIASHVDPDPVHFGNTRGGALIQQPGTDKGSNHESLEDLLATH